MSPEDDPKVRMDLCSECLNAAEMTLMLWRDGNREMVLQGRCGDHGLVQLQSGMHVRRLPDETVRGDA